MTHILKTDPLYFWAIWNRNKLFEARKDDRNFQVGDTLHLVEYSSVLQSYSKFYITAEISFKLEGERFGIKKGFCILSLKNLQNHEHTKREVSALPQNRGIETL